ncbi:hypothetical protein PPACK8108_LOCUS21435 [Phakopsora pachyrhizi]|uniref:CLASP N-terminal domain-containing protein n=1 Tax=Phakopsora pachyrhizi TaxID=170000 RepID=A0AAV0BII4_PHAPC|nr:hypothetical protein PPACK8108_LOCUS21435 [Phakopsora pachyrhizi]
MEGAQGRGFRPTASCLKPAIKIKADYYDKLVKALAGRISDTNILCMIGAANCIKYLAKVMLSDLAENIVIFSKHKNPQVKKQTKKFLVRCLCNTENQIPKTDEVKSFLDMILGRLEDAFVSVREAFAEGLETLMKLVGKATFSPIIQG